MGGNKNDSEKVRWELLSVDAINEVAKVMTFGAEKYDAHNWRGGFDWSRLIGAAYRHLSAWHNGQDKDPESGFSHLAHLGCCVMFLLEHELRGLGTDDRYKHSNSTDDTEEAYNEWYEENVRAEGLPRTNLIATEHTSPIKEVEEDGYYTEYPKFNHRNQYGED